MTQSLVTVTAPFPPIVLIVNEGADTLELYERMLSGLGCWVTSSHEAEAFDFALDIQPDAIIADVDVRPQAAGAALLHQFHSDPKLSDVPVVLVTSGEDVSAVAVEAVLVKPVEPAALIASIQRVLETSRSLRTKSVDLQLSPGALLLRGPRAMERSHAVQVAHQDKDVPS